MKELLAFVLLCLAWGSTFAALKAALSAFPPILLAAARLLLAGGLLFVWIAVRRLPRQIGFHELRLLVLPSLLTITMNYGALFWAAQLLPSGLCGVVSMSSISLSVSLFSIFYRQEAFSWFRIAGLFIGVAGLFLLFTPSVFLEQSQIKALAVLIVVLGSMSYGLGSVFTRFLLQRYTNLEFTAWQMTIGGAALLTLSLATEPIHDALFARFSCPSILGSLLYLVLVGSILGFTIHNHLLKVWTLTRVSSYTFFTPIVALVVGNLFLGEQISFRQLSACVVILFGGTLGLKSAPHRTES